MYREPRMGLLHSPNTFIFGSFYLVLSLVGTILNMVVLKILRDPFNRTRTNTILMSRVCVDILTVTFLAPFYAAQLFNGSALMSVDVDIARRYFTFVLSSASYLTLAVIAYDRCVLLSNLNNYEDCMNKRKCLLLILLAWLIPVSIPFLYFLGTVLYICATVIMFCVSFVSLVVSYLSIKKAMRKHRQFMEKQEREATLYGNAFSNRNTLQYKRELIHLKIAKMVLMLIFAYVLCRAVPDIWFILDGVNKYLNILSKKNVQMCYAIAFMMYPVNSCLNPIIYFYKNSQFRRDFRRLFCNNTKWCEYENMPSSWLIQYSLDDARSGLENVMELIRLINRVLDEDFINDIYLQFLLKKTGCRRLYLSLLCSMISVGSIIILHRKLYKEIYIQILNIE